MMRIPVGVLGATGLVGQHYLRLLADHPWFEVTHVAASDRSIGKMAAGIALSAIDNVETARQRCKLVFSAVNSSVAQHVEARYAAAGLGVISNASYHRTTKDVPVVIPEVNPEHLEWIFTQQRERGWKGFIVAKPNCTVQSFLLPLAPLHKKFKAVKLSVTTMQAVSGAGYPGIPSLDILDRVNPYIADEEEKVRLEPLKILGCADLEISAQCNRIPVRDGHFAQVSVQFSHRPEREEILELWERNRPLPQLLGLPSAPEKPVIYVEGPETRWDLLTEGGMAVSVGQLKRCPHLDFSFLALSHNAVRGAAGGGLLTAELLVQQNYLKE